MTYSVEQLNLMLDTEKSVSNCLTCRMSNHSSNYKISDVMWVSSVGARCTLVFYKYILINYLNLELFFFTNLDDEIYCMAAAANHAPYLGNGCAAPGRQWTLAIGAGEGLA